MKSLIYLFFFSTSYSVYCQSPADYYHDFYQSKKYYSLNKLDSALKCINRFEKTSSFDIYGASLKLKILHQLRSKRAVKVFFRLVEQTGIEISNFEYEVLKNKKDSAYFLGRNHNSTEFAKQYKLSRKKYLSNLSDPFFSIEIEKIMTRDQCVRDLEWEIDYSDSGAVRVSYDFLKIVDRANFERIKTLFSENGLPTQEKIGSNQFSLVLMAGMHLSVASNIPEAYSYFDSVFLETLKIGQLSPEYYMFFKDAVSRKTNKCQIYGYLQFRHPELKKRSLYTFCNPNVKEINKARRKIGAGSILDQCRFESVYCNFKYE